MLGMSAYGLLLFTLHCWCTGVWLEIREKYQYNEDIINRCCYRGRKRKDMKTGITTNIESDNHKRKYDAQCKKVLSDKHILAYILKNVVEEVEGYTIEEIIRCIEGSPEIGSVSVLEGGPGRITEENTEDVSSEEGTLSYDIRFSIITKEQEKIKLLIDLEAQKNMNPGYRIVTRGIVYCGRMISSQINLEFTLDNYDGCKKVYSIWLCFQAPEYIGNAVSLYHIRKEDLICGIPDEKKAYDKLCVAQICLRENSDDARNEMIRLLNTVFSQSMTKEEILEQLEKEYRIPLDTGVRKEIDFMCDLSEMIEEKGRAEGRIQGRTEGRMEGEKDLGTLVRLLVRDRKMDLLEEVTLNKEMREKLYREYHITE